MYLLPSLYGRFNTENILADFESLIKTCVYQIFGDTFILPIVISLLEIFKMISKI